MSTTGKSLPELVKELPPDAQMMVRDFVEFLLMKYGRKSGQKLRQDWTGILRDYRDQYTALELQQKALEREEEIMLTIQVQDLKLEKQLTELLEDKFDGNPEQMLKELLDLYLSQLNRLNYSGILKWEKDGLTYQKEIRSEWQ